jgi:hypothetical protein
MRTLAPNSPERGRKVRRINEKYLAILEAGFPATFGDVEETLQVAREVDGINWLTLLGICNEAVAAGFGDALIPAPGIRTTANRNYRVTFSQASAIIRNLRAWGLASWANWGRLKDLARNAPTREALNAIDLERGWP